MKFLHYSHTVVGIIGVMLLGSLAALSGSLSGAVAEQKQFVARVQEYSQNGISLSAALREPVRVTTAGNMQSIDNPLKYDFLRLGQSFEAISGPLHLAATFLDLVTFIVLPLTFALVGAVVATYDQRAGTMRVRCSMDSWGTIVAAKLMSLLTLAVISVASVVAVAALLAVIVRPVIARARAQVPFALVEDEQMSALGPKIALSIGVAVLFGLVGYTCGALTGSSSWPIVILGVVLFAVPFLGAWDPRNALAVVATRVYDFWGQFELRPPQDLSMVGAVGLLVGTVVVCTSLSLVFPRGRRRYGM